MKNITENYVPFGAEWEKEMMKFPKPMLIDNLRAALKKIKRYEEYVSALPDRDVVYQERP